MFLYTLIKPDHAALRSEAAQVVHCGQRFEEWRLIPFMFLVLVTQTILVNDVAEKNSVLLGIEYTEH